MFVHLDDDIVVIVANRIGVASALTLERILYNLTYGRVIQTQLASLGLVQPYHNFRFRIDTNDFHVSRAGYLPDFFCQIVGILCQPYQVTAPKADLYRPGVAPTALIGHNRNLHVAHVSELSAKVSHNIQHAPLSFFRRFQLHFDSAFIHCCADAAQMHVLNPDFIFHFHKDLL